MKHAKVAMKQKRSSYLDAQKLELNPREPRVLGQRVSNILQKNKNHPCDIGCIQFKLKTTLSTLIHQHILMHVRLCFA